MNPLSKSDKTLFKTRAGEWLTQHPSSPEPFRAFIPKPLPQDPPLRIEGVLARRLERAGIALGRLDGLISLLPDPSLFLYTYVRQEAVLSSQIEGTQSSLSDLLLFEIKEAPGVPIVDVREVSNYVRAMEHGLQRLKEGFPLSNRLLREIHAILLEGVRSGEKGPGDFRRSQNWIGGSRPGNARYVPPPPERVSELMSDLEKFLHAEIPVLLKAGLAHAQFESIHPFLDGNGRIGRLLITLVLCKEGTIREPILYLSLFFKEHQQAYYDALQQIRKEGDWEGGARLLSRGHRRGRGPCSRDGPPARRHVRRPPRQASRRPRCVDHGRGPARASDEADLPYPKPCAREFEGHLADRG